MIITETQTNLGETRDKVLCYKFSVESWTEGGSFVSIGIVFLLILCFFVYTFHVMISLFKPGSVSCRFPFAEVAPTG